MTDRYGHPRQSIFNRRHASAAASVAYSTSQHPPPPTTQQQQQQQQQFQPQLPAQPRSTAQPPNAPGRALFRSQLTRRPPPKHGLHGAVDADGDTVVADEEDQDVDGIVVRDINGDFELEEPPSLVVEDPEEIVLDMRQENEKERQRLADAVKQHQSQQNTVPAQPEELLEAVRASLRAKVAALAEDTWMYEPQEEETRLV
ncbi:hypothetical protein N0V93_006219 [Gnomoniopsis smithogilvyi]|uniref:Uncharacterized protein n=1 Tax=Gnomoniopsis smithogilvyi TaxID=1191159 RepID=A0A9W9CUI8_9PEZI|nr:hypothetical protein N0V93_006219 [Gnomoniopsis smithogilvyi]